MNSVLSQFPMLAQIAPSKRFAASFRSSGVNITWDDVWPWLLSLTAVGIAHAAFRIRQRRNDMSQATNDPWKLFRHLCMAHQLDGASRRLVKKLSLACGFEQPAQVFLVPEAFGGNRTPDSLLTVSDDLKRLRGRLF